jgi:ribosomal protein L37E
MCHDETVGGEHDMQWATRMICGHCAKEQPFSKDAPCVACGLSMTKSRAHHWQVCRYAGLTACLGTVPARPG